MHCHYFFLIAPEQGLCSAQEPRKARGDEYGSTSRKTLGLEQFVFLLWVPSYNSVEPSWAGVPFFYWYQMLWVIISGVLTAIVYFAIDD